MNKFLILTTVLTLGCSVDVGVDVEASVSSKPATAIAHIKETPSLDEVHPLGCDVGGTGLCYELTPFGVMSRRPTLHEAFGERNL